MLKKIQLVSSVFLLAVSTLVLGGDPVTEPALAHTFKDAQLKWGPCPPFIPKGCEIAVLHGDPAKPNVDVFFKVPAGSTIPSHTHTSAERMVLVSGEMDVTYEGQASVKLRNGSYAYGPANKAHQAVCARGAPCVLFIAFESPLDAMPTASPAR